MVINSENFPHIIAAVRDLNSEIPDVDIHIAVPREWEPVVPIMEEYLSSVERDSDLWNRITWFCSGPGDNEPGFTGLEYQAMHAHVFLSFVQAGFVPKSVYVFG